MQTGGDCGQIPLVYVPKKICPAFNIVVDGLERVEKLGQLDEVQHQRVRDSSIFSGVEQLKAAVMPAHFREENRIDGPLDQCAPSVQVFL
jgi:hypothetical protein